MGLPLAAQFASHGWHVTAVDVQEAVVAGDQRGPLARRARSRASPTPFGRACARGRLRATTDGAAAARDSDVVVLIVPVMLDDEQQPDYRYMDAAVAAIAPGRPRRLARDLRDDAAGRRHAATGSRRGSRRPPASLPTATSSSPSRRSGSTRGAVFRNLAAYPKLVGGVGPASTERAVAFYASVLDADVVAAVVGRGRRVLEARRHDLPRRQHRARQRVRALRRSRRRGHPGGHRARRTPSPTRTSTSPASASAATASRSTPTSC